MHNPMSLALRHTRPNRYDSSSAKHQPSKESLEALKPLRIYPRAAQFAGTTNPATFSTNSRIVEYKTPDKDMHDFLNFVDSIPNVIAEGSPDAANSAPNSAVSPDELVNQWMLSPEVKDFINENLVKIEIATALQLAERHFSTIGKPWCELIDDPDFGDCYLAIHLIVSEGVETAFLQSESFLSAFVVSVDPIKQRRISVVYHPTRA
jgi:hypothetical protein